MDTTEKNFYMIYVEDTTKSAKRYCDSIEVADEAKRLAKKLGKKTFVMSLCETFTPKDINEEVNSYAKALEFLDRKDICFCGASPKHNKALEAFYKLITIAEAWNKADDFIPNFDDKNQAKWFPWFIKEPAGFVCATTYCTSSNTYAYIGSRLCFKSSARAKQFGTQYINLWNDLLLFR